MMPNDSSDAIRAATQRSLATLVRTLKLSAGHFAMILARCNSPSLSDQLVQQVSEQALACAHLHLDPQVRITSLYTAIHASLTDTPPAALMVFGLETVSPLEPILTSMNSMREEFRKQFPFPIVLWVTDAVLQHIVHHAPDFESWMTTCAFEFPSDDLIQVLQQQTQGIFQKTLELGARRCLPTSLCLSLPVHLEIEAACQVLQQRSRQLDPELRARLDLMAGLKALAEDHLPTARSYLERSCDFWQTTDSHKRRACTLYYLGFWWRIQAARTRFDDHQYQQACQHAQTYFQNCVTLLEQDDRPDLAARFINAWGEVLQRRHAWDELLPVAQKAITWHLGYADWERLAYAYGLRTEVAIARSEWFEAKQIAEKARTVFHEAIDSQDSLAVDDRTMRERQTNQGWYLLLLATAEASLNQMQTARRHLEQAKDIAHALLPELHIRVLEKLQSLYGQLSLPSEAFHIKRKLYSIQQQYRSRAFIGAGYLPPYLEASALPFGDPPTVDVRSAPVASKLHRSDIPGRQSDVERIIQRLNHHYHKVLVLYGPPGVGKTSLIRAGLVPTLLEKGMIRDQLILAPIVTGKYDNWVKILGATLAENVKAMKGLPVLRPLDSVEKILEQLRTNSQRHVTTLFLFDQLDDFFGRYRSLADRQEFYDFLRQVLSISSVKVILSLRPDKLQDLLEYDRYCQKMSSDIDLFSYQTTYHLSNFSPETAKSVIQTLTQQIQPSFQPEFIDQLVADLADKTGEISPLEIQIIGSQLEHDRVTTLEEYRSLGKDPQRRIQTLVESWLGNVIQDCGPKNRDTAWKVLYYLTDQNIQTIKTVKELSLASSESSSKLREAQIKWILRVLMLSGIASKVREASKDYYQLNHDYLIPYIRDEYHRHEESGQRINQLRNQLIQGDFFEKLDAAHQLAEFKGPQVIKALRSMLDKDPCIEVGLRWQILTTLAQSGDHDAYQLIVEKGLNDPEPCIQAHAATLLGRHTYKSGQDLYQPIRDLLMQRCQSEHRCVRLKAQSALEQLKISNFHSVSEAPNLVLAYVLIKGKPDFSLHVDRDRIRQLRELKFNSSICIVEGGVIYGDYDILVKVSVDTMASLNEIVISKIQTLGWVQSTRTSVVVNEPRQYYWKRRDSPNHSQSFVSYVFIQTVNLSTDFLVACLMDIPEVSEAASVYGQYDVIAKIEADELQLRDEVLARRILRIPAIQSTHSYSVLTSLNNLFWDNNALFTLPKDCLI